MEGRKAKELAAAILKIGVGRVYIDPANLAKISEAMTKDDVRALIAERIIKKRPAVEQSRGRARDMKEKRSKGRMRGKGKRSATRKVRSQQRKTWMGKVRALRRTLREVREKDPKALEENYSEVYNKIKGSYFRGKRHLTEYIEGAKK
jgi:large subunit ribosomal protein L19e